MFGFKKALRLISSLSIQLNHVDSRFESIEDKASSLKDKYDTDQENYLNVLDEILIKIEKQEKSIERLKATTVPYDYQIVYSYIGDVAAERDRLADLGYRYNQCIEKGEAEVWVK